MKRKQRVKIITAAFLLTVLMSACQNNNQPKAEKEAEEVISEITTKSQRSSETDRDTKAFPEQYNQIIDNLIFETNIIVPENLKMRKIDIPLAAVQKIDWNIVKDKLFDGVTVANEMPGETMDEKGYAGEAMYYMGDEGQVLNLYPDRCTFNNAFYYDVLHAFDLERNPEKYSNIENLSFASKEEVFKNINNILQEIGVLLGEKPEYKAYALKHETMEAEEYAIDMEGNEDISKYRAAWIPEDDSYYFTVYQTYKGMPVFSVYAQGIQKMEDWNAPVQVLYSTRGLEYLGLGSTYLFSEGSEQKELLEFDKVAEKITEKYTQIITDSTFRVKDARLCLYPYRTGQDSYDVKLIWVVDMTEQAVGDDSEQSFQNAYDACTAEEIY